MKKEEIKQWLNDVYTKLWELFSLCEETNGFCVVPEGAAEEEPHDFISRKIEEIRSIEQNFSLYMDEQEIVELKKLKPKLMTLDPGLAVMGIVPEVGEVFDKLHQIINDSAQFLERHIEQRGAVGAVFYWQTLNPHLTYFDGVFDLMEQYPETYKEMGFYIPCEFPGPELVAERNAYFEKMKEQSERENLNWSKDRFFQEELQSTLKLLFERAFKEYL
ncbi:MAG: hypothetical protein NC419_06570 [Muribaculaceae bacterium]|nr:hypothetical protein [Muribaculaceae bacterium]